MASGRKGKGNNPRVVQDIPTVTEFESPKKSSKTPSPKTPSLTKTPGESQPGSMPSLSLPDQAFSLPKATKSPVGEELKRKDSSADIESARLEAQAKAQAQRDEEARRAKTNPEDETQDYSAGAVMIPLLESKEKLRTIRAELGTAKAALDDAIKVGFKKEVLELLRAQLLTIKAKLALESSSTELKELKIDPSIFLVDEHFENAQVRQDLSEVVEAEKKVIAELTSNIEHDEKMISGTIVAVKDKYPLIIDHGPEDIETWRKQGEKLRGILIKLIEELVKICFEKVKNSPGKKTEDGQTTLAAAFNQEFKDIAHTRWDGESKENSQLTLVFASPEGKGCKLPLKDQRLDDVLLLFGIDAISGEHLIEFKSPLKRNINIFDSGARRGIFGKLAKYEIRSDEVEKLIKEGKDKISFDDLSLQENPYFKIDISKSLFSSELKSVTINLTDKVDDSKLRSGKQLCVFIRQLDDAKFTLKFARERKEFEGNCEKQVAEMKVASKQKCTRQAEAFVRDFSSRLKKTLEDLHSQLETLRRTQQTIAELHPVFMEEVNDVYARAKQDLKYKKGRETAGGCQTQLKSLVGPYEKIVSSNDKLEVLIKFFHNTMANLDSAVVQAKGQFHNVAHFDAELLRQANELLAEIEKIEKERSEKDTENEDELRALSAPETEQEDDQEEQSESDESDGLGEQREGQKAEVKQDEMQLKEDALIKRLTAGGFDLKEKMERIKEVQTFIQEKHKKLNAKEEDYKKKKAAIKKFNDKLLDIMLAITNLEFDEKEKRKNESGQKEEEGAITVRQSSRVSPVAERHKTISNNQGSSIARLAGISEVELAQMSSRKKMDVPEELKKAKEDLENLRREITSCEFPHIKKLFKAKLAKSEQKLLDETQRHRIFLADQAFYTIVKVNEKLDLAQEIKKFHSKYSKEEGCLKQYKAKENKDDTLQTLRIKLAELKKETKRAQADAKVVEGYVEQAASLPEWKQTDAHLKELGQALLEQETKLAQVKVKAKAIEGYVEQAVSPSEWKQADAHLTELRQAFASGVKFLRGDALNANTTELTEQERKYCELSAGYEHQLKALQNIRGKDFQVGEYKTKVSDVVSDLEVEIDKLDSRIKAGENARREYAWQVINLLTTAIYSNLDFWAQTVSGFGSFTKIQNAKGKNIEVPGSVQEIFDILKTVNDDNIYEKIKELSGKANKRVGFMTTNWRYQTYEIAGFTLGSIRSPQVTKLLSIVAGLKHYKEFKESDVTEMNAALNGVPKLKSGSSLVNLETTTQNIGAVGTVEFTNGCIFKI